jgi:hypothetical protein
MREDGVPLPAQARSTAGMTLLEAVVWIGVFLAVMSAIVSAILYFYRSSDYAIDQASAVISAERGVEEMVQTIRYATYAGNGAYPIVSLDEHSLLFYADIDSDVGVEKVRYYVSGTSLMKGVVEPSGDPIVYTGSETSSLVSEHVRNQDASVGTTTFLYYDEDGDEVTDYARIGDVRFVTATVLVDVDPQRSPTPLTLRSSAALRNLSGL